MKQSSLRALDKTERLALLLLLANSLIYAFICTPVYIWSSSNVVISRSVFPIIWDTVQQLVILAYYWIAFSSFIYLAARCETIRLTKFYPVYVGCSFMRYFLSLLIGCTMEQDFGDFFNELGLLFFNTFMDAVQLAFVVLIFFLVFRKVEFGKGGQSSIFAFERLFDGSNPVLKSLMFSALVLSSFRLISRIIFDVFFGNAQNRADLIWMIFYYCSDILSWLVGYFVMYLAVTCFHRYFINKEKQ